MGLFDKLLGGQTSEYAAFDQRDAFTALLLAVVAADGDVSSQEAEEIVAVSNRLKLYAGQSVDQFNSMINKLVGYLRKHGLDALLERAYASLPSDLRQTAFAVAADLAFADGHIEPEEHRLLEKLQERLEVPADLASTIVSVLIIKNRG